MIVQSTEELASCRDGFANAFRVPSDGIEGLCGFDGFVDSFVRVQRPATMALFGPRVEAASGIATSFPATNGGSHFGGNGPLLTLGLHALLGPTARLHYIGGVGDGAVDPIFREGFGGKLSSLHALAQPAHSTCLEFDDGKVMLSDMESCEAITWERLVAVVGETALDQILRSIGFVGAVNWGKLPSAGEIWLGLARRMRALGVPAKQTTFFMDLAEFEHRAEGDVRGFLESLPEITQQCRTTLSLNLKEAWQLAGVLGYDLQGQRSPAEVIAIAVLLQGEIGADRVIVHPNDGAACASRDGATYVLGPVCEKPYRSTGAGDHFGAGVLAASALGLDDRYVLLAGVCASGYFIRSGRSPSAGDLIELLDRWIDGTLPERLVD